MHELKRKNHFVPQLYLRQWSPDRNNIWAYRTLVSHENVPVWEFKPIKGITYQRDLYTELLNGQEVDEFERWMESEYETPAKEAINKVISGEKLTTSDWNRLALFLAAQDVRTPTSYIEFTQRWEKELPSLLEKIMNETLQRLENRKKSKRKRQKKTINEPDFFQNVLKVQVFPNAIPEIGKGLVKAEVVLGRKLWLKSQKFLLKNTAKKLMEHKWSIVQPAKGNHWFTSDHPVVRLNYYGNGNYDLKGGWGNNGANLMMPLSPDHLLFTQIGSKMDDRFSFSSEKTFEIQRIIADRSHRWIFSHREMGIVKRYKQRLIDNAAFKAEEKQWQEWHEAQCKAEE